METNFLEPFYQVKLIKYLWWHVFFCEVLGENGREYRKLVLISNNFTEVSDENGTIFFFFYDLNGSIHVQKWANYVEKYIIKQDHLF